MLIALLFVGCEGVVEEQLPSSPVINSEVYNVLLDGDSRTDGWNCSEEYPYINLLNLGDSVALTKVSYGGATTEELVERGSDFYLAHFDASSKVNIVVIWIGANDFNVNNKRAGVVYKNLARYCYARKAEGWEVIVCTEISINGGVDGVFEKQRLIYNQLIYLTWRDFANRIADLGRNTKLGPSGSNENSQYFCDGVHLTNTGTNIVASIIEASILNQLKRKRSVCVSSDEA